MALTAGLLAFLAFDALCEAFELQAALPGAFGGTGLTVLGVAGIPDPGLDLGPLLRPVGARRAPRSRDFPWPR